VAASKGAAPASAADTLREESQLLMRVRQALSASEGLRALELVAEHRRAFGAGTLTQERDVMEVQALVQLGRVKDAKAHAKAFLQRYPGSPHTEKVRAIVER
jgi:outer membrane protein assembly factor BamD (BamD/ComL family)